MLNDIWDVIKSYYGSGGGSDGDGGGFISRGSTSKTNEIIFNSSNNDSIELSDIRSDSYLKKSSGTVTPIESNLASSSTAQTSPLSPRDKGKNVLINNLTTKGDESGITYDDMEYFKNAKVDKSIQTDINGITFQRIYKMVYNNLVNKFDKGIQTSPNVKSSGIQVTDNLD